MLSHMYIFTAELCVIPALVEIFPVAETKFLPACSSFSPGSKSLQIFSLLHEFFAGNQCAAHSYGTLTVILRSFIPVIRSVGSHKIFLCINRYKKCSPSISTSFCSSKHMQDNRHFYSENAPHNSVHLPVADGSDPEISSYRAILFHRV